MVKAIHFFKRKPGMDFDSFAGYWRTTHAAIVKRVPGLRRYVQSLPLGSIYQGVEPVYDGVTEAWFDDAPAMRRGLDSSEGRAAHADDANFMDLSVARLADHRRTHPEGRADYSVNGEMDRVSEAQARLEPAAFQKYWREKHGPLAATLPPTRRYVQSHVQLSAYSDGAQPRYDGMAAVWIESSDAMLRAVGTPEYEAIRTDELNFLDHASFQLVITNEFVIL